jgi:hypothetical protein
MVVMSDALNKTERTELAGIVRRNFRVAKAGIEEQRAKVLADFEAAIAHEWDPVELAVVELVKEAEAAVDRLNKRIATQFMTLGLPEEWAPRGAFWLSGRGENQIAGRRAELRKQAVTRAEAQARTAKLELERQEAELLTRIATTALDSAAAQAFLGQVPNLAELMPAIEVEGPPLEAVSALLGRRTALSAKRAEAGRIGGRASAKAKQIASESEQVASDEDGES